MSKADINFHIHTTHSDGRLSVSEVVDGLKAAGVGYFAITDHDCVEGVCEAANLAEKNGMSFVNGVELSFCFETEAGLDFTYVGHILSYGFDISKMRAAVHKLWAGKLTANAKLFERLVEGGYALRRESCFAEYSDFGLCIKERKTLARELVELGYAPSVNAAFNKILNVEPYLEYAKNLPYIKDGIKLIHDCGGIAVASHPFGTARGGKCELKKSQVAAYLEKLREYGVDGIEVFYQAYDNEQIEFLSEQADKYGFLKSTGTDFHGLDETYSRKDVSRLAFEKEGINIDKTILSVLFN